MTKERGAEVMLRAKTSRAGGPQCIHKASSNQLSRIGSGNLACTSPCSRACLPRSLRRQCHLLQRVGAKPNGELRAFPFRYECAYVWSYSGVQEVE